MSKVVKTIKIEIEEETYQKFTALARLKGLKIGVLIQSFISSYVGREWSRVK